MPKTKFVKDKAHNRFPAYCCEDIDTRVGRLEEAVAALVAGTVPDGSITLAKLAADARTYKRDLNSGLLFCEWIGTQEQYEQHVKENGGDPLVNCRYTVTDGTACAIVTTDEYAVGSLMAVYKEVEEGEANYSPHIGDTVDGLKIATLYKSFATKYDENPTIKNGTWRCIGYLGRNTFMDGADSHTCDFYLFQRIK